MIHQGDSVEEACVPCCCTASNNSECCSPTACLGGCCCCSCDEISAPLLLRLDTDEQVPDPSLLEDLRALRGLSNGALVTVNFSYEDVLRGIRDEQLRLQQMLMQLPDRACCGTTSCNYQPRPKNLVDSFATRLRPSRVLPFFRWFRLVILSSYSLIVAIHVLFLWGMYRGWFASSSWSWTHPERWAAAVAAGPRLRQAHRIAQRSLQPTQLQVDLSEFRTYYVLANMPMPFVFLAVLAASRALLQRLLNILLAGIAERVRRLVHLKCRQVLEQDVHSFAKSVKYFYAVDPEFDKHALQDSVEALHKSLDSLNANELRYDRGWSRGRYAVGRVLKDYVHGYLSGFSLLLFVLPFLLAAALHVLLFRYVFAECAGQSAGRPPPTIDWRSAEQTWQNFDQNKMLKVVLATCALNVGGLCYATLLLGDETTAWLFDNTGLFAHAAQVAACHANWLIYRAWEVCVVQKLAPFVTGYAREAPAEPRPRKTSSRLASLRLPRAFSRGRCREASREAGREAATEMVTPRKRDSDDCCGGASSSWRTPSQQRSSTPSLSPRHFSRPPRSPMGDSPLPNEECGCGDDHSRESASSQCGVCGHTLDK